ncbi:receptor-type tyrosine-protein phosphatase U [Trichonephila clavipes]|nr:receptor-type tyrosine-protein phosphatase U [Trichonephila clavipes]
MGSNASVCAVGTSFEFRRSDGCGRTGAYICIDSNLDLVEEDGVYDVYGYTKSLRNARRGMIEDVNQYRFIYDALEEAFISGQTWFPVSQISQRLKQKSQKNPITRQNEYQREYQKICKTSAKFTIGDRAGGHRLENRDKNRTISTVPQWLDGDSPREATAGDDRYIVMQTKRAQYQSASAIAQQLYSATGLQVSWCTVAKRLYKKVLFTYRPERYISLKVGHRQYQLQWFREHKNDISSMCDGALPCFSY